MGGSDGSGRAPGTQPGAADSPGSRVTQAASQQEHRGPRPRLPRIELCPQPASLGGGPQASHVGAALPSPPLQPQETLNRSLPAAPWLPTSAGRLQTRGALVGAGIHGDTWEHVGTHGDVRGHAGQPSQLARDRISIYREEQRARRRKTQREGLTAQGQVGLRGLRTPPGPGPQRGAWPLRTTQVLIQNSTVQVPR